MNIAFESRKSDGAERLIQVTIPVDDVNAARQDAARKLASRVSIPGFRPGKAPAAMVMKRYGDAIKAEALDHLVQAAYREVIDREKIKVASQPHVHDLKFEDGQPVSFELHVEIRPELTLSRTSGFKVERTERHVTDEQVSEQLEQLREQRANWSPVEGKPMEGDLVTVTLATAADDGTIPEGKEYKIVLGAGHAIPGIEEVITELEPGASAERLVKWPDDFPDEAQRGHSKMVCVALADVKRKSLPNLDDALAREVGDFDSLEALRTAVRADMLEAARRETDAEVRSRLLDEIIGANSFDVPPSWVQQTVDGYANAYQIPDSEKERFVGQFRPTAERQVRRDLIVETLAETENLKASEGELDDKVTELAEKRGQNPGQVYATLQKAGRLAELERGITEEKVFKWLFERNTIE
ncbi:MAG: trigger factor [Gemmatimonadaceae bacterium]|nr:trigger factor [Gemmatimonadaceae bacterium]